MVARISQRLEDILQGCEDETMVRCPTEDELLNLDVLPDVFSDADAPPDDDDDKPGIDDAAMQSAVKTLKILFSQGPAAMFRLFGLQATLFSECAKISCADCDADVNLLDTFVLESSCAKCNRPRCMNCARLELAKKKRDQTTTCRHCAPQAWTSVR